LIFQNMARKEHILSFQDVLLDTTLSFVCTFHIPQSCRSIKLIQLYPMVDNDVYFLLHRGSFVK
jgi:hypothetical protein